MENHDQLCYMHRTKVSRISSMMYLRLKQNRKKKQTKKQTNKNKAK